MILSKEFDISKLETMDKETRLKMCFKIFDNDRDGKISMSDVLETMKDISDTDTLMMED